ncbi:MAG: peroxide stress protein YaaA [Porphyromonadaceae bacterium]|nr:peroxide stress protein YaaA [Porphyromonadaceae bacterium]
MITLISPAKIQNFKRQNIISDYSQPIFLKEAKTLVKQLRTYSINELSGLLEINSKLAEENAARYFQWKTPFTPENSKQAIFVYNGAVYQGLDPHSLSNDELHYLQNNLRMMTGLYGMLRPLDLIQPYRLEVKTKFLTESGENLYDFWRARVTKELANTLKTSDNPDILLNLASKEYTKMIDKSKLNVRIVDFDFLQYYPDTDSYKHITIYLKRARGLMARFIAQNRISDTEHLKGFSNEGFWFSEEFSSEDKMVFVR